MKVSVDWLKDYVAIDMHATRLAHRLTMAGLEVEQISSYGRDNIFELEITPNRPDCLNVLGLAREVSAILNKPLKTPHIKKITFPKKACPISIEDKKDCSRYIGTIIEGIMVDKTPGSIVRRLEAVGLRSINNIVDITNFSLMENGQPLHAFDLDKLEGKEIVVRRAKNGERIVTIDDVERELDPSILVIADAKRPVAIAGIMGGKDTEVTAKTKNILLESAYFDPIIIRRASRKLGLSSDSSYRFERGVDFDTVDRGAVRAISLILEHAKGKITARTDCCMISSKKRSSQKILFSVDGMNNYLGATITVSQCKNILNRLEFDIDEKKKILNVTPPRFRHDVKQEVDVIEEVSRVIGYDNLPSSLPQIKATTMMTEKNYLLRKKVRELLMQQGFNEMVTFSMVNQKALDHTNLKILAGIKIQNPLTQDQEMMRPSILPNHLSVVASNINKGQKRLKLFETGKIYTAAGEKEVLAITMTGLRREDWRELKNKELDFYDLKGAVESIFVSLDLPKTLFESSKQSYFEKGQRAAAYMKAVKVADLGKMNEDVLNNWGIKNAEVFYAQIDLSVVYRSSAKKKRFKSIIEYPTIVRDVSLSVKKDVSYRDVKDLIFSLGSKTLADIKFTEEYLGDKIQKGHRGLVFSLIFQTDYRTLREDEVNLVHKEICEALVERLGVVIR